MKVVCATDEGGLPAGTEKLLPGLLYARSSNESLVTAGAAVKEAIEKAKLEPAPRANDLLSIGLCVTLADLAVTREDSPDGWTREIELTIPVRDVAFWKEQIPLLERQLRFLTTDIWQLSIATDNRKLVAPAPIEVLPQDCVALLSGGLDSLVGTLDLVAQGKSIVAVSQIVAGDREKQTQFAATIGKGLRHFQFNHVTTTPGESESTQRARSFLFFAYGVLVATSLKKYRDGGAVDLYLSENGLISINPPLTAARIGGLSTRTTHPAFIAMLQALLDCAGLRVRLLNPYQFKTKGEMLAECRNQKYLVSNAATSTSCGRFARFGFRHCGRCVPCLIRRAAFHKWGVKDTSEYVYADLGKDDDDHAGFDDVRSAAMAVREAEEVGLDRWLGACLVSLPNPQAFINVVSNGMRELKALLDSQGVT